jgi:hypothetical protein
MPGCDREPDIDPLDKMVVGEFQIIEVPRAERPFNGGPGITLNINFDADSAGIVLYNIDGEYYYQPVQIVHKLFLYLDGYYMTDDVAYLDRAEQYAAKLLELSELRNNARYFPYNFNFPLHKIETDMMRAPWYSGMAQGEILNAFVRLYIATEQVRYLEIAHEIFRSLIQFKGQYYPWTVDMDNSDYYWIEEYPLPISTQTINGFGYAVYGLYEYYLVTQDKTAEKLLKASLATLLHYFPQYRVPGEPSYYCLYHRIQHERYHRVHFWQMEYFYRITGHPGFKTLYEQFYSDFN